MLDKNKVILWDFDGVLMNSNAVRDLGFEQVLSNYPKEQIDELMLFHRMNGGLSRYVKFRYFFENIRNENVTEGQINVLAQQFSNIMLQLLQDEKLLIENSVNFVKNNYEKFEMHIVSGSDGMELNIICNAIGIAKYFKTISGSPTPKKELVKTIVSNHHLPASDFCLIGDSINDFEAAETNGIFFYGYNNIELNNLGVKYINSFNFGGSIF